MLSDEEKEAIDFFEKSFKKKIPPYWYDDTISNIEEKIKVILNLIEKQSKEIEGLNLDLEEMTKSNNHKKENWVHKSILNSYVSKDKIKEILDDTQMPCRCRSALYLTFNLDE